MRVFQLGPRLRYKMRMVAIHDGTKLEIIAHK
jgi:hypothetical protein